MNRHRLRRENKRKTYDTKKKYKKLIWKLKEYLISSNISIKYRIAQSFLIFFVKLFVKEIFFSSLFFKRSILLLLIIISHFWKDFFFVMVDDTLILLLHFFTHHLSKFHQLLISLFINRYHLICILIIDQILFLIFIDLISSSSPC